MKKLSTKSLKGTIQLLIVTLLLTGTCPAWSQEMSKQETPDKPFHGFYSGIEFGSQNVFSGALIDDIDVLTHKNLLVMDLSLGYRWQFAKNRVVANPELRLGFINGELNKQYQDRGQNYDITYSTNFQIGVGIKLGYVLGESRRWLIYSYAFNSKREFDIKIDHESSPFEQSDENAFLRYGLGVEYHLNDRININGSLGKVSVDFGDAITTESVTDKMDTSIGVVFTF